MPTVWEGSYVSKLKTLNARNHRVAQVVEDVRRAIEPLIMPDAAKILAAMAVDVMTGIEKRNNRKDVNAACGALRKAIAALDAVDPNLDG